MSTLAPGQIWYLVKFLLFPTRFLSFIALLAVLGFLAAGLTYTQDSPLSRAFYLSAAMLFTFLLLGFFIEFYSLAYRKTLALCGAFGAYLSLIGATGVGLWCLIVAAAIAPPMENAAGFWRMSLLIAAPLSLGVFLGAVTRLDLLLISSFTVLALSFFDLPFPVIASAYQQGSISQYGVLLLLTGALWICLYRRIKQAAMPTPLMESLAKTSGENNTPIDFSLGRLLAALPAGPRQRHPDWVLLLESRDPSLKFFTFHLLTSLVGALVVAWLLTGQGEIAKQFYRSVAGLLVLISSVQQLDNLKPAALKLRRLWLLIPGSRGELFRKLERGFWITTAGSLIPVALVSVGLFIHVGEPAWWSLGWVLFVVVIMPLLEYLGLLFLPREDGRIGLVQSLTPLALIIMGLMLWYSRNPIFFAAVLVPLMMITLVLRYRAVSRWAAMDYSLVKNRTFERN